MNKFLTASAAAAVLVGSIATAQAAMIVPAQFAAGTVAATNETAQTVTIGKDVYYGVTGVDVGADVAYAFVIENGKRVVIATLPVNDGPNDDNAATE